MRPEEKWLKLPKDPNQKRKRNHRPKSKRVAAKNGNFDDSKSDAPDMGSEGSSPADAATDAEVGIYEDGLQPNQMSSYPPLTGHGQSTTGMPSHPPPNEYAQRGKEMSSYQSPGACFQHPTNAEPSKGSTQAATSSQQVEDHGQGRFQSASVNELSHNHPAAENLTPKPLRRQLFPSPKNGSGSKSQASPGRSGGSKPLSELPNVCRRSPRLNKSFDVFDSQLDIFGGVDKENSFPDMAHPDDLDDLFNDPDGFFDLPKTPSPARRSDRLLLKTPSKTPKSSDQSPFKTPSRSSQRLAAAARSPTAQRSSQPPKTPQRSSTTSHCPTAEDVMTPFSRAIHDHLTADRAAKDAEAAKKAEEDAALKRSQQAHQYPGLVDGEGPPEGGEYYDGDIIEDPVLGTGRWDGKEYHFMTHGHHGQEVLTTRKELGLRRSPRKNKSPRHGTGL
jgi:hypothetical protein